MATILQYDIKYNIATLSDLLDLFKDFAVSCGWTLYEQIKGKKWGFKTGQNYGFWDDNAGENYLELRTTDFGGNTFFARLQVEGDNTIATDGKLLNHSVLNYDGTEINKYLVTSATHPYLQAAKTNGTVASAALTYAQIGARATLIPQAFFFGNNKVLYMIIQFNSSYIFPIGFGVLELLDQTEGLGWWTTRGETSTYFNNKNWVSTTYPYNGFRRVALRPGSTVLLMEDVLASNTLLKKDWFTTSTGIAAGVTINYGLAMVCNGTSKIRPAVHNYYYLNENSVYRPFAKDWHVNINTYGLEIGEQLKLGNETFISFPHFKKDINYYGFAFRVS